MSVISMLLLLTAAVIVFIFLCMSSGHKTLNPYRKCSKWQLLHIPTGWVIQSKSSFQTTSKVFDTKEQAERALKHVNKYFIEKE